MLVSRGVTLLRAAKLLNGQSNAIKTSVKSHGTFVYREASPGPPKIIYALAEGVGGIVWWWILWHCWTQYDHLIGEFDYPDSSKWTDEELGIPPVE